jgi:glycosyltransferase involved in cell wall biosynthesis
VKVLVVIDSLVPAGAERSLVQTAPLLRDRGLDVAVATIHDRPGLQPELRRAGIEVVAIGGDGRIQWVKRLSGLIAERRPDLVHTTLFEADMAGRAAARLRRVPVVTTIASEPYSPAHLADPRLDRRKVNAARVAEAVSLRLAARVHAVSEPVAEAVASRLHYPRARIDVVPRGRDGAWLGRRTEQRHRAARRTLGIGDSEVLALTVARQEYIKGLDVLIDSAPELLRSHPSARILVAGRPTSITAELEARIDRLGLTDRVRLLGERDDVPELLAAADVFILPTRREGFPGSIVEAMALEVPVVATGIPEVRAVVDDTTAVLVPLDDAAALADGVREALDGPDRLERVARARREFESRLTLDPVADAMIDFYRRATGIGASRAAR